MRTVNASLLELFSTLAVEVSPLRERKEDIIPLLQFFLNQYNYKAGQKKRFDREVISVSVNIHGREIFRN